MYTPEELKEAGLDNFRSFLHQVWVALELRPKGAKKPIATPLQNDIAKYLQFGDTTLPEGPEREGSRRRQIIEAYRGVGKSFITVAYVLWILLLDPQKKIMVVSATEPLASDFAKFVKQLIDTMPILQHLKPRQGQRTSVLAFDVGPATPDKSPSIKAVGITGQLTGSRADVIVADDIEIPKNSYSQVMREKLAIMVREFDAVLKPGGKIVYLGTPQVEASLYNSLQKKGYVARVWPAEVPADLTVYAGKLGPYIKKLIEKGAAPHTPTNPTMHDRQDLDERKLSWGRGGYLLQYMLDTTISDDERHPLKLRDLLVTSLDEKMCHVKYVWGTDLNKRLQDLEAAGLDGDYYVGPSWVSEEMSPFTSCVMAIDPSGRGNDETGYAILKQCYSYFFLVEVGGFREGSSEKTMQALAAKAIRWGVNDIIIEENFGGGTWAQLLQPLVTKAAVAAKLTTGPKIEEVWHSKQKETRIIDTLQPILNAHRLIVSRQVIEEDLKQWEESERYSFIYQLSRITRERGALGNEDRLEAVQMACEFYAERLNRDADKEIERHKARAEAEEVKRFLKKAREFPGKAVVFGRSESRSSTRPSRARMGRV